MSVKCFHFLRWKLLLMCEVLLGLLLLINKEGKAVLFLARAYVRHKNAEGGEDGNLPHRPLWGLAKVTPSPALSSKSASMKHVQKPLGVPVGRQPTGDLPRSSSPPQQPLWGQRQELWAASGQSPTLQHLPGLHHV